MRVRPTFGWWRVGIPFAAATNALQGAYAGLGATRVAMYMTGLVNAVNLPLGLLLIFALDLGVAGAGLATLLATMAGTAFMVWYGRRRLPADLGLLRRASLAGWRAPLRPLLRIAWPESTLLLLGMANEAILVAFVARLGGRAMIGESDTPPCTWGVKLALECTVSYHFQRSWSPG